MDAFSSVLIYGTGARQELQASSRRLDPLCLAHIPLSLHRGGGEVSLEWDWLPSSRSTLVETRG